MGAHVDEHLTVAGTTQMMHTFDPAALNAVIDHCPETVTAAIRAERVPRPIMMLDAAMSGFAFAGPPEAARPYGDGVGPAAT